MIPRLSVDFDKDAAKLYAESGTYTKSSWDFMKARSMDLSAFKNRGGNPPIVHGIGDPVFSINNTIAWWNDVNNANSVSATSAL